MTGLLTISQRVKARHGIGQQDAALTSDSQPSTAQPGPTAAKPRTLPNLALLLMIPEVTPPLLQLTYRPDLEVLVGRWGYQPEPYELPAVYQQVTAAALQEHSRFWLQDIRRRSHNDPKTTTWLLNEYFPDMASRLGGRLFVAYLVGPILHEAIVSQPDFVPAAAYDGKPFVISFFGDEGAAVKWLQDQQRPTHS